MASYEDLAREIRAAVKVTHGIGASEAEVAAAEKVVGQLPDDYRAFLREFGWLDFNSFEIWGLGKDLPFPQMDFSRQTTWWRRNAALPTNAIGFYEDGGGNVECFLVRSEGAKYEQDVFSFFHEDRQLHRDAASFSDYVLALLRLPPFL